MSLMRTRAVRSLQQGLRAGAARPMVQGRTQFVARRYASSGGHGKEGSDLPWLISALVVTPVGAYFLWPSSHGDAGHHGHDEHHEEHHEEAEAKEEEAPQEEESKDEEPKEEESKGDDTKDEEPQKTDKPSGTEGESQPRADGNKKSSGKEEAVEKASSTGPPSTEGAAGTGPAGKGQMKNDSEGMEQSSKREPDGKGGFKVRKDSGLQKDLTVDNKTVYADDDNDGEKPKTEAASPAKPGFSQADTNKQGEISSKQSGMSNSPTRHSIPIHEHDDKSKKPEGGPDTAKSMGTIDPNRPAK